MELFKGGEVFIMLSKQDVFFRTRTNTSFDKYLPAVMKMKESLVTKITSCVFVSSAKTEKVN